MEFGDVSQNNDALPEGGKCVKIVSCDSESGKPISLHKDILWKIFNQQTVSNLPVVLLSIVGAYRTGKSFLLNFLLRYLEEKEKDRVENWLKRTDAPLTGFPWAAGAERTTEGITMWSRPFVLHLENNRKVALFVMDSQGLFDGQVSSVQANILVTLSTLLSSIQVYNVMRTIDESALKYLELFAEAGSIMQDSEESILDQKPFQRLVFLVRDWIGGRQHKFGEKGGKEYLEKKFSHTQDIPEEGKKLRLNIKKSFQLLDCFLMPNPGMKAVQQDDESDGDECQQEFKGLLKDLSTRFVNKLEELVDSLLKSERILIKACAGLEIKCSEMPDLFLRYVGLFADGEIPKPATTRQALLDHYNSMLVNKIMLTHGDDVFARIVSSVPCLTQMDVHRILLQSEECSTEQFQAKCRGSIAETKAIRDALLDKFKDKEKLLLAENEKMMYYQKEKNREFCKEQLQLAEQSYINHMKELRTDQPVPVEVDLLEKLHKSAAENAKRIFMSATEDKEEERIPFLTNLIDFLGDHHRRYSVENHIKMNQKNMEKNQRFMAVSAAEEFYIEQMDKKYKTGQLPKTTDDFDIDHTEQKKNAIRDYNRLVKDVPLGREEDLEKLEKFFKKERERFAQINNGNQKWTQDKDNTREGRGYYEARMAYRRGMTRECMKGKRYREEWEMRELHEMYKEKAYEAFRQFEKECFKKPTGWQAYVDMYLEDEYKDILPRNELNHPKVLRVMPKDFLRN